MSTGAESPTPHAFRLVLEYDGRNFEGWQIQAGARPARTIQGVLCEAVESLTGQPASVRGAGRTDAGVHALGQVASVRVATAMSAEALARALNGLLPADIVVRESVEVTMLVGSFVLSVIVDSLEPVRIDNQIFI